MGAHWTESRRRARGRGGEVRAEAKILLDFVCPDDRAAFEGHYLPYRGLVIATDHMNSLQQP